MNFTSSPYEHTMEEVHHDEKHARKRPRRIALCGLSVSAEYYLSFLLLGVPQRAGIKGWYLPPTEARRSGFGGKGGIVGASEETAFDGCKDAELVPARGCGGSPTSVFCGPMGCKK